MTVPSKADILKNLQSEILRMEGFRVSTKAVMEVGLSAMRASFPNGAFPLGAVHEFLSPLREDSASASGFVAGLSATLMGIKGVTLWISASRTLFPPALTAFGLLPERFIFLDLKNEKEVLWAMDEALKCGALSAVIGEMKELDFTASRRLQLAVEQSQVTGFVMRSNYRKLQPTACVSRWHITSLPSAGEKKLPGIGFPTWNVELVKMRNGKPGAWNIQWRDAAFRQVYNDAAVAEFKNQKIG